MKDEEDEDMLPEYDLSGGVRGKYVDRYRQGTNVVLLDPNVAARSPIPRPSMRHCGRIGRGANKALKTTGASRPA